jgi:hypothetical protein
MSKLNQLFLFFRRITLKIVSELISETSQRGGKKKYSELFQSTNMTIYTRKTKVLLILTMMITPFLQISMYLNAKTRDPYTVY